MTQPSAARADNGARDRRIAGAVAVVWGGRALQIALSLLLTRALFDHLRSEEIGLWFLLARGGSLTFLIDLGLHPVLARHLALARGGAASRGERAQRVLALVAVGRRLSARVTAAITLAFLLGGGLLLYPIGLHGVARSVLLGTWGLVVGAQLLSVYAGFSQAVLVGLGQVGLAAALTVLSQALQVATLLVVTGGGGHLLALGAASVATAAATWAVSRRIATRRLARWAEAAGRDGADAEPTAEPTAEPSTEPSAEPVGERTAEPAPEAEAAALRRTLLGPAVRYWLTALGGFFVLRTDAYFIALARKAADVAAYTAAYQVVSSVHLLAVALAAAAAPFVSELWAQGARAEVHRLARRGVRVGLFVMVAAVAVLLTSAEDLFTVWLGPGRFVGWAVLGAFSVMLCLETQHVTLAAASRATEDEVFWPWALVAGVLNLVLTAWWVGPFGLPGVAGATVVAQVLTNNWYVVYRAHRRLEMPLRGHLSQVLLPVGVLLGLAWAASYGARAALPAGAAPLVRLLAGAAPAGAVLGLALLREVLRERRHAAAGDLPVDLPPSTR